MQTTCNHANKEAIWHGNVTITTNERVAEDTFRLQLVAPKLVPYVLPGQFLMLRLINADDPLLGRPLAVYRVDGIAGTIEVVYLVVGKMTRRLSQLPAGTPLQAWGPLGNGFDPPETDHLIMVAGGIGQTPFYTLAEECLGQRRFAARCDKDKKRHVEKVSLLFGAKSQNRISCLDEFRELGVDVKVATEDGSQGLRGLVTDLIAPTIVEAALPSVTIVSCGPRLMLRAVFHMAESLGNLPCYVSLESPMACGLGICFSCVVKYRDETGDYDFVRTCVDGPVFDAYRLDWES